MVAIINMFMIAITNIFHNTVEPSLPHINIPMYM